MGKREDLSGQVFGWLTAKEYSHSDKYRTSFWLCECKCGGKITTASSNLKKGCTRSCGCLKRISDQNKAANMRRARRRERHIGEFADEEIRI